jgi:uncharacterized protein
MKNVNEIKLLLSKYLADYKGKYKVISLGIFGSYSRGEQVTESDVDIVVEFEQPIGLKFVSLANELENVLQMKVDLVSRNGIKPKYWEIIEKEILYV